MLDPLSDESICICTNCMELQFNRQKVDELTNDVLDDLNTLYGELKQDLEKCEDQETRDIKFQKILVKLEAIENSVVYIHNDLKDENNLLEDLDSNFGITVQIESLDEDLARENKMHDKLRIEWYSQEEHLNRLVEKVHIQDTALENQSIYCTTQGFTLSKMLWKISNRNDLLDQILLKETLTQGIFQTFKNCLEAFTLTYRDKMPKPTSPEYQFVLSLAGTISNVSAVPDGRFFIINHIIGETVLSEIIKSLPKVRAPNAESLKWILLTIIHNMLVCKEGEEYAKRNELLLTNLTKCTSKPNSERIIILAIKILASLTTGVSDEMYMNHIIKSVPVKGLRQLKKSADSAKVGKHVSCLLSSVMKVNKNYRNMENEKLIRTTQLNDSRSSCRIKCKPSKPKPKPSRSSTTCCCCYLNEITRFTSNDGQSNTSSFTDFDESNGNYTSSVFSKHPTQSSMTLLAANRDFNSESSSICCCCPSVIDNMSIDESTARHKRKQFYTGATEAVMSKTARLNLTVELEQQSESSSMEEGKENSIHLDFDSITSPNESAVDDEDQEVGENQSNKCIQCSCDESADPSTTAAEVEKVVKDQSTPDVAADDNDDKLD